MVLSLILIYFEWRDTENEQLRVIDLLTNNEFFTFARITNHISGALAREARAAARHG